MDKMWLDEMADDHIDTPNLLLLGDSVDEKTGKHGGSLPGRSGNIERGRFEASQRLLQDYISDNPVYNCQQFCRRFRLSRLVFTRVVQALEVHDPYFTQRKGLHTAHGFYQST